MNEYIKPIVIALSLAVIMAMVSLFQAVDRNTIRLNEIEKTRTNQFEYVLNMNNILIELKTKFLWKEEHDKDK